MISGLRNAWETWAVMEARNRRASEAAFSTVLRICRTDNLNLDALDRQRWADYAAEVEMFLDATAAALNGERAELEHFMRAGQVEWREKEHRRPVVRMGRFEAPVAYDRPIYRPAAAPCSE